MAQVSVAVAVLISALLIGLCDAASFSKDPLDPKERWYKPYDRLRCDLSAAATGPAYRHCPMDVLTRAVQWGSGKTVFNRPVLARQTGPLPPPRWIMLEVHGGGNNVAMLAVRADNLYVVGFATQSGAWYLIPSATILPSSDNYQNLEKLGVGRTTMLQAISRLSGCVADYAPDTDGACVRRAVAALVVTLLASVAL